MVRRQSTAKRVLESNPVGRFGYGGRRVGRLFGMLIVSLAFVLAVPALAEEDGSGHRGHDHGYLFKKAKADPTEPTDQNGSSMKRGPRRPAVAAPNIRVGFGYEYLHVDPTSVSTFGAVATTLQIPNLDGHAGSAELIGTFPLTSWTGLRGKARFGYGDTQRSVDGTERGNNESASYGAALEVFVRDPDLFSISVGGGYDRLDGDRGREADEFQGSAEISVFFPEMGVGRLDWTVRFDFTHRQISGNPGTADLDADRYTVTGTSGWYWSDDFRFALGGRWDRAEEEFLNEEDREGFAEIRWLVPVPGPVSVELSVLGSAGLSEFKQPPFKREQHLVYGAEVGVVFRFGSGRTLIESIRAYD